MADFGAPGLAFFLPDPSGAGDVIILDFAPGFTGTGPVISTSDAAAFGPYASGFHDPNGNKVSIASGFATSGRPRALLADPGRISARLAVWASGC